VIFEDVMVHAPLTDPKYEDITDKVTRFAHANVDSILWYNLNYIDSKKLFEKSTYTIKSYKKPGLFPGKLGKLEKNKTIVGKLKNVESCLSAPRVLVNIETVNGDLQYLSGTLFGAPSNLGVLLDDVLKIE